MVADKIMISVVCCLAGALLMTILFALVSGLKDSNKDTPSIACIDGVEYITGYKYDRNIFTGHFKPDGSLYTCSEVK